MRRRRIALTVIATLAVVAAVTFHLPPAAAAAWVAGQVQNYAKLVKTGILP